MSLPRKVGVALIAAALIGAAGPASAASRSHGDQHGPDSGPAAQVQITADLGDFVTPLRLDYPAAGGPAPVVMLIHGAGNQDLDATVLNEVGVFRSHNFADISAALTARGFAVLRYDKHYVTGPDQATDRYAGLSLPQMTEDARTVLRTALTDRRTAAHIDSRRVFLFGWSEGSTIAAALAAEHPEFAGLVIQGGVNLPWRDGLLYQARDVAVPYLRRFAVHGRLNADGLRRAWQTDAGRQAKEWTSFLIPGLADDDFSVEPTFDANHDGAIDIDRELLPALPAFVDQLLGPSRPIARYGPGRALPTTLEQAPHLHLPVLILQGEKDGNVPAVAAVTLDRTLDRLGNQDHHLRLYPGLGHSLGPAPAVWQDQLLPIDARPLNDLATWLRGHRR
ncbi:AB hydrolase-1 domain-containing protein [Frankia sp. AiPs1]|uniref:alpha/beta hydrolase family protein n=1 Tax=Frankia sp. AiPa1 TaxID=573492 RepID=UPI00202ACEE9|nr:alpha/beta hydrolase [Frankia sp. AiPa1]MCL9762470.1 lysophospholipase [Frankia sp. AiPa1]